MPEPAAWIQDMRTSRGSSFPSGYCGDWQCEYCAQLRASRDAEARTSARLTPASVMGGALSALSRLTGGGGQ